MIYLKIRVNVRVRVRVRVKVNYTIGPNTTFKIPTI
jgi:hypothetical protein